MLKKLIGAFATKKADRDIEHGLSLVKESWLTYKSQNPKPHDELEIIQFVAPFLTSTMRQLTADSRWSNKSQLTKLNLIFAVLLADAETEIGREKLQAMRDHLAEKA